MRKILLLFIIFVIIIVVGVLIYQNFKKGEKISPETKLTMPEETSKKTGPELSRRIAIIIAFRDFRDEEYFIPKQNFERAGFSVATVSTSGGLAIGTGGGEANVDFLIDNLNVSDYDAILFIGGPGAAKYIDDEKFHQVAREAIQSDKILGAICIAPAILAKAGALNGKKATVWNSLMDKSALKILKEAEAIFQEGPVVTDSKIVTANGPAAAGEFAQAIIGLLKQ